MCVCMCVIKVAMEKLNLRTETSKLGCMGDRNVRMKNMTQQMLLMAGR